MQQISPSPSSLVENLKILPIATSTALSETSAPSNDTHYSSLLLKKKLAMLETASKMTSPADMSHSNDSDDTPVSLIKPSSTTLSINENEPVKSASRRRKPLRPWSLSARVERPNANNDMSQAIEPISDPEEEDHHHHPTEMKYSPVKHEMPNSNHDDDEEEDTTEWPRYLSTIEEILKLYRVESNGLVQCIRCGVNANQDNLLEHVSVHYPYKCYSCGFYADSSSALDGHNRIHLPNNYTKSLLEDVPPLPTVSIPPATKSSDLLSHGPLVNSEKSTPPSKAKVHRCRQCSFVSSVKEDYWAHHRVHIRADKILECPSCPFVTEYKHHLEYHLRNHLGSKPFKCSKCDYACVNLSMLRSHKKSHYRHLLFKCVNCSFESKQYQALQEHLQIEGHEALIDENIEEFLKEYANGNMTSSGNHNTNGSSPPTSLSSSMTTLGSTNKNHTRPPPPKKRKTAPTITAPVMIKRTSSTSSIGSSAAAMSPISNDEHQSDSIHHQTASKLSSLHSTPLVCSLCDYVAVSKEGLGVHLFQHACKKSDLLNRSLLAGATVDPATKLMELFNGKMGPFSNGQLNDFIAPYQQFLTQQIQTHLTTTSALSSASTAGLHPYHLDNNNNHAPPPSLLNNGYSLLSSCIKNEANENHLPSVIKTDEHVKRQRKGQAPFKYHPTESSQHEHGNESATRHDQQTQVDECQIKRLFECFHCEIIFKDFAMYCTHKQLHYSPDNPFRCAQCGEQKANKYDFFVHVAQQAHELT